MIQVRRCRPEDAQRLGELNRAFNGTESTVCAKVVPDRAGQREVILVAELDGNLAGFACLQIIHSACYTRPWAEVTELYVQPEVRRRGVGRCLMQEVERQARSNNVMKIHLRTDVANKTAHALYAAMGFSEETEVVFSKLLREAAGTESLSQ